MGIFNILMTIANFVMTLINAKGTSQDRKLNFQERKRDNTLKAIHVYRKTVSYYENKLNVSKTADNKHLKRQFASAVGVWSAEYLLSKHSHIDYEMLEVCIGDETRDKVYKGLNALYKFKENAPYRYSKSMKLFRRGLKKSGIL